MATKAPTGLAITRSGNVFTCTWKRGQSYNKKQQFAKNLTGEWETAVDIGKAETSKTVSVNFADFYPNTETKLPSFQFEVRGLYNRSWSAFTQKSFTIGLPNAPTLEANKDENLATTVKFTWSVAVAEEDTGSQMFTDVEYQSILLTGSNITDGTKLDAYFKSTQAGWLTGKGGSADTRTVTENSADVSSGSHTRWFRVRSRGPAGASAWRYAKFVYAAPNAANITEATATKVATGGYQVMVKWNAVSSAAYPIDQISVEYSKAVPGAGLTVPAGASWTTARTLLPTGTSGAASFMVDGDLDADQVLFVRVNTEHESQSEATHSAPKIAVYGKLAAPEITDIVTNDATFRATITATKNSNVPDAFTVIQYRTAESPSMIYTIGVISSGTSYTAQLPDWTGQTKQFGVYNAVGTYSSITRQDGTSSFAVNATMKSDTAWDGGAVPNAPTNVTVASTDTPGTVRITWDWPWQDANSATISWANHADAWQSTDEPEEYTIENTHANEWYISDLETGQRWYFRVRLTKGTGDSAVNGAWSEPVTIDLSSAPVIPTLSLSSGVITEDGSVSAFWSFVSTDGTGQAYAEVCEATISGGGITYGNVIASAQTAQHVTIYANEVGWNVGETHYLCVRVVSSSGRVSDGWSDPVPVIIAAPLEITITDTSLQEVHEGDDPHTTTASTVSVNNSDGMKGVTSLVMTLTSTQSGSGTTSPSNVRPISGYTEVVTKVWGGNVWDEEWELGAYNVNTGAKKGASNQIRCKNPIMVAPNTEYFFKTSIGSAWMLFFDAVGAVIEGYATGASQSGNASSVQNGTFITPPNAYSMVFYMVAGYGTTYNHDISINYPSTDTEYHAYNGNTYTTALGQTVYGGTLDVVTGELTLTKRMVKVGSLTWSYTSDYFYAWPAGKAAGNFNLLSDTFATTSSTTIGGMTNAQIKGNASNNAIYVKDNAYTSAAAFKSGRANAVIVYDLATPEVIKIPTPELRLRIGSNYFWSDTGNITLTYATNPRTYHALTAMPLTATITGAGNGGITQLIIERAESYHIDRPNEEDFNGYQGETIAIFEQTGEAEITINREDLYGTLDDGAAYNLIATIQDGLGQSATETIRFEVHWAHQAIMPTATVRIEDGVAVITATAPSGSAQTDTIDIYRLSADLPELVVKGGAFGTEYVDPYPAIDSGYRIVTVTANGDYITAEGEMAWVDVPSGFDSDCVLIDFDGQTVTLPYNVELDSSWEKDFQQKKYLGGAIVGDWNKGTKREMSVSTVSVTLYDAETIASMRSLAKYDGICHIRTQDGSSFKANLEVSERRSYQQAGKIVEFTIKGQRIDSEELDGMTYAEWDMGE